MTLLMLYAHPKNRPKNKQSKTKQSIKQNLETEKRIAINYILAKYEKRQKNY